MTDRVYTLRQVNIGRTTGKFYTSPYTAILAGERLRRDMPNPEGVRFALEMSVLDIQDVPCDHTVVKDFVSGFVNHIHKSSHAHGFVLLETATCEFELLRSGTRIAEVMILYIPPSLDVSSMETGEPVLRVMTTPKTEHEEDLLKFRLEFATYCDVIW